MEAIVQTGVQKRFKVNIDVLRKRLCSSSESCVDEINFHFSNKKIIRRWFLHQDSRELMGEKEEPAISKSCHLSLEQLLDSTSAEETIKNKLSNWHVPEDMIKDLVQFTISARSSISEESNVLAIVARIIALCNYNFQSVDVNDGVMRVSTEESGYNMIPATNSSIKSLKSKTMECDANESCSICLDEFSNDYEAICMPCSHVFHGNCIEKWLMTSHYCPICRYEMPTN